MINRILLRPEYSISRIIKGGWHLAGGHGNIDERQALEDMRSFVDMGITTFDCADIYTGVEELIGKFVRQSRSIKGSLPEIEIHTKYVPDYHSLASLTKVDTERIIDRSLMRLGVERLDLVQFAWWNYDIPGHVDVCLHLQELKQKGKIRYLGVTNYDAMHLEELLEAGLEIVCNQVQYSLLDHRPESNLIPLCRNNNILLLCYGVLAGGFLSDRYLGAPDPPQPLENRSLTKYRLIIDEFGGYDHFQKLLMGLQDIANIHQVGIAEIAISYILEKKGGGSCHHWRKK